MTRDCCFCYCFLFSCDEEDVCNGTKEGEGSGYVEYFFKRKSQGEFGNLVGELRTSCWPFLLLSLKSLQDLS